MVHDAYIYENQSGRKIAIARQIPIVVFLLLVIIGAVTFIVVRRYVRRKRSQNESRQLHEVVNDTSNGG